MTTSGKELLRELFDTTKTVLVITLAATVSLGSALGQTNSAAQTRLALPATRSASVAPAPNVATAVSRLELVRFNIPHRIGTMRRVPEREFEGITIGRTTRPPAPPRMVDGTAPTAEQCEVAERALLNSEKDLGRDTKLNKSMDSIGDPLEFADVWQPLNEKRQLWLEEYTRTVQGYLSACFAPYNQASQELRSLGMERLAGVLQVQLGNEWRVFCSAFRISISRIVTARHCFYALGRQLRPRTLEALAAGKLAFVMPEYSLNRFPVSRETCAVGAPDAAPACKELRDAVARGSVSLLDDYLALETDTSAVPMPAIAIARPPVDTLQYVTMLAWTKYPEFVEHAEVELGRRPLGPVGVALNLPRSGVCVVAAASDVCMLNGCQSTNGTSGAAVFAASTNALTLLGIHVAAADGLPSEYGIAVHCDLSRVETPRGAKLGNVARVASPQIRSFMP